MKRGKLLQTRKLEIIVGDKGKAQVACTQGWDHKIFRRDVANYDRACQIWREQRGKENQYRQREEFRRMNEGDCWPL